MDDDRQPPSWPMLAGIAGAAALAGFGVSHWLVPGRAPPPAPADAAAGPSAASADVRIPAAYIRSANIAVEAVGAGGIGAEITAPATVAATPQGEAIVVARASGTIARVHRRLGDTVRAGETLALVDSLDAATFAADRSVAAAKADLARRTFAREAGLFRQGVTPRQDMESAQSALAVADAEARRASAVASAAHVAGNGRSVAVISPIGGKITAETAMLGAFVEPQAELFRIANGNAVEVEASVTADEARRVAAGDPATIILSSGSPVTARVRSVTPTVSGTSQSATVVLIPQAGASELVVGQGVQVRIRARAQRGDTGLSVPEEAVQSIDGRDVLFVRTPQGFRARPVLVGIRSGGMAQILSGVKAGEPVATRGAFLVKAESKKGAGEDEE